MNTTAGNVITPLIGTRLALQGARIDNGVTNGQLTSSEASALQQQEGQVVQGVSAAKQEDGYVPASVRAAANQQLSQLSQSIYDAKNGSISVPNAGAAGSLQGVSVWGDPHITDQSGNSQQFSQPNGLFIEQNANGQDAEVLMSAPAYNQPVDQVQVLADGQAALPVNASQTEVYVDQNGTIVADGTAASLGFTSGGAQGQLVGANSSVQLSSGTTVNNQGGGSVTFT